MNKSYKYFFGHNLFVLCFSKSPQENETGFNLALSFFSAFPIFDFYTKLKIVPWIFLNILAYIDNQMKGSINLEIDAGRLRAEPKRAFYSYVLIDSYKLSSLLNRKQTFSLLPDEPAFTDFEIFKSAIFYIGKGTNGRKLLHLTKAKMQYLGLKVKGNTTRLAKIVSLWGKNRGVTILQLECDATSREALSREFAMISAVGLDKLANVKQGECYGDMNGWPTVKIKNYGDMLLFQMFKNFIARAPSPIMASDVPYKATGIKNVKKYCKACKRVINFKK